MVPSVEHRHTERTYTHYKTAAQRFHNRKNQKIQPLDRFVGQDEGYLENTYTEREAHNFITRKRYKLQAGTEREKHREREREWV